MKKLIFLALILFSATILQAKTERNGYWMEFEISKKISKKFDVSLVPEFRFQDEFKIDEYLIDGVISYDPFKFLKFGAEYRWSTEIKKNENVQYHRVALDANGKTDLGRFEVSLRTRFTTYLDDNEEEKGIFFRPRLKLKYNIPKNKKQPFVDYKLFHDINHSEFTRSRLDAGAQRKLGNGHRLGLYYRLQDYFTDRQSLHILGLEYKFSF